MLLVNLNTIATQDNNFHGTKKTPECNGDMIFISRSRYCAQLYFVHYEIGGPLHIMYSSTGKTIDQIAAIRWIAIQCTFTLTRMGLILRMHASLTPIW